MVFCGKLHNSNKELYVGQVLASKLRTLGKSLYPPGHQFLFKNKQQQKLTFI